MAEDRDSRRTGSPRRLSEILPAISGSTRRSSPSTSVTTGTAGPARGAPSATGPRPGASGAVARLNELAPDQVRRGLVLLGLPRAAASCLPSVASTLAWSVKGVTASDGQFDYAAIADVVVRPGADSHELDRLEATFAGWCEPMGPRAALKLLGQLAALTQRRAHGEIDDEIAAAAYAERLGDYPADVAERACDVWANRETWWPAWAELRAECDRLMRGRRAILTTLQQRRTT